MAEKEIFDLVFRWTLLGGFITVGGVLLWGLVRLVRDITE